MPPTLRYASLLSRLRTQAPTLRAWPARRFCLLVVGLLLAQSPSLPRMAAHLRRVVPATRTDSLERRLRRALADPRLSDPTTLFEPLARHALQRLTGRVYLLLDDTAQAATGAQVTLLALAYGGRAVPLAWCRWVGPLPPGQYWRQVEALFDQAQRLLPAPVRPLLLADAGLGSGELARRVGARGWDYLLRLPGDRTLRVAGPDGQVARGTPRVRLDSLAPRPGTRFAVQGLWFERHHVWASALGWWKRGQERPWLLLSNLPPDGRLVGLYAHRMQVEMLFKDTKSGGLDWERSHVREPARAARLVDAVLTGLLLAVLLGEAALRAGEIPAYGRRPHTVSRLRRGLDWLLVSEGAATFRWVLQPTAAPPHHPRKSVRR